MMTFALAGKPFALTSSVESAGWNPAPRRYVVLSPTCVKSYLKNAYASARPSSVVTAWLVEAVLSPGPCPEHAGKTVPKNIAGIHVATVALAEFLTLRISHLALVDRIPAFPCTHLASPSNERRAVG
jgi:hypothetical protein